MIIATIFEFLSKVLINRICLYNELQPATLSKAKCNLAIGRWKPAIQASEEVLFVDQINCKAIFIKAEALYNLCYFEHALLLFHRGQVCNLYIGIYNCTNFLTILRHTVKLILISRIDFFNSFSILIMMNFGLEFKKVEKPFKMQWQTLPFLREKQWTLCSE